jgi:hypothetical protein
MAIVYSHIRLDKEELFYIGIGKTERRAYSKHSRNSYWNHIVNKTEYQVKILYTDLTWEEACKKEIELINQYKRKIDGGILVNLTLGGDGNTSTRTEETKKKISMSCKGRTSGRKGKKYENWYSETEVKARKEELKKKMEGSNNPIYGKKRSEEIKDKIKNKLKGKSVSIEHATRNRTVCLGRKYISKDGIKKKVIPEEIEKYLKEGWKLGQKH